MGQIRLQFVAVHGDLGSDLIAWFGHTAAVSHVDAVLPNGTLLGARMDGGVQIRAADYEKFTTSIGIVLPATDEQEVAFLGFLHAQIGKPYDHTAIMAFAADRNWQDPDSWFCSELQAAALHACHWFPHDLVAPFNKIAPADLLLVLSAFVEVPMNWNQAT